MNEWLRISTSTELVRVRTEDIVFVQADGNYSDLWLINGKSHNMTFKLHYFDECFQKLQNNMFVRVGKSLIVNKKYIYVINVPNQYMKLCGERVQGEFRLQASKEALKELKALIENEEGGNEK